MIPVDKVAKYIIRSFHEKGDLITNLKLQKLLYYVQGWHLGIYNEPLFSEELQAWVHGPVQPAVYKEYKKYTWNPITQDIESIVFEKKIKDHIDEVLEEYGGETGWQLERMTHREEPWIAARKGLPKEAESTEIITHESLRKYFNHLANESQN